MRKLLNIIGVLLAFGCFWVFLRGLKVVFNNECVYVEGDVHLFHKFEDCDRLNFAFKKDEQEVYKDTNLYMCPYCYSEFEINNREEFIQKIKDKYRSLN
jgi:hypothetical protein